MRDTSSDDKTDSPGIYELLLKYTTRSRQGSSCPGGRGTIRESSAAHDVPHHLQRVMSPRELGVAHGRSDSEVLANNNCGSGGGSGYEVSIMVRDASRK